MHSGKRRQRVAGSERRHGGTGSEGGEVRTLFSLNPGGTTSKPPGHFFCRRVDEPFSATNAFSKYTVFYFIFPIR